MRIGILTFHNVDNYGAAWQCYGLGSILKSLGHDPFLVNYRPPHAHPVYRMPRGRFWVTPRMIAYFKKRMSFNSFRKSYLPPQTRNYQTLQQLQNGPPVADALIAGSDQIWNPSMFGGHLDPAYFLGFGKFQRKVAYAASFGESRPLLLTDELRELLANFDFVSVRESLAARKLEEGFGMNVAVACDPAILVEDYRTFLRDGDSGNGYVFCYNLFNRNFTDQASCHLAKSLQCEVRRVNDDWKFWKNTTGQEFGIGPVRWLNLINQSRLTISDSFHATVFSIMLEKNFLVVLANKEKGGANRIVSLLSNLGLDHRIVSELDSPEDLLRRTQTPVDWSDVKSRLKQFRDESLRFLRQSLQP